MSKQWKGFVGFYFFTFLFATLSGSAIARDEQNPFAGTWELVSGKYLGEDKKWTRSEDAKITALKILNDSHYSFISLSKGEFWGAGSGTYQFEKSKYSEIPVYVSYPMEKGQQYHFTYEMKDGIWTNRRYEKGELVEEEFWRKVQSKQP
ncbi:hypothetical protein TDB9533_04293 [Thalassocella blandensis]|nr:hypothetical protein TDB9533_04293 [Thalassocella blandensis]